MQAIRRCLTSYSSSARAVVMGKLRAYKLPPNGLKRTLVSVFLEFKTPVSGIKAELKEKSRHKKTEEKLLPGRHLRVQEEEVDRSTAASIHLRIIPEPAWLSNVSFHAACHLAVTMIVYYVVPKAKDEVNLSMFWCILLLGFSVKLLFSIAGLYFKSAEAAAERSVVIVSGFAFFVLALGLLIISEENLELGLDKAYSKFNESASVFLEVNSLDSEGPASKLVLKLILAAYCGISGALLTFPGMRVSRMHSDALLYNAERPAVKMWLHLNFIMPFLVAILWVKPIARHYFTVRIFTGLSEPLMTGCAFDTIRLWSCVICCILRLTALPCYLQAYLNMADRQLQAWKKEAGKTTNLELQKTVARVYYYLCVVALQYVAPIFMCLAFTYMYKTLGGFSWTGTSCLSAEELSVQPVTLATLGVGETLTEARGQWELALTAFKQVFAYEVFRGLFGFFTWWSYFLCFASSALGFCHFASSVFIFVNIKAGIKSLNEKDATYKRDR
nr:EOG090X04CK [Lepidurus arcticus]